MGNGLGMRGEGSGDLGGVLKVGEFEKFGEKKVLYKNY